METLDKIQSLKDNNQLGMNERVDAKILPEHYMPVSMPFYRGDGEHSIKNFKTCANGLQNIATNKLLLNKL
jgi:hypothetical protein